MTMDSRRILVTGLSTYWGGRLAQALEAFPEVEAVVGVDSEEPQVELERTEYVKVGAQHALLRRVVEAAEIDTVVDTRLVVDSATTSASKAHENNVIGTMNILAAC
jgi:UDP-glucose 4-epimerase